MSNTCSGEVSDRPGAEVQPAMAAVPKSAIAVDDDLLQLRPLCIDYPLHDEELSGPCLILKTAVEEMKNGAKSGRLRDQS